uniref:Uncharacterized protein n=1 Tax=Arundo donax TaxID=35708 RepID=A0A0A9ENX8_ARUDO
MKSVEEGGEYKRGERRRRF